MSENTSSVRRETETPVYADFEEFYAARYPRVISLLHSRGAGDQAEDIAQETFVKLFAKFDDYQGGAHNLNALATTAALNTLIDFHRRNSRRPTMLVDDTAVLDRAAPSHAADPSHIVVSNEFFASILHELPEHQIPVFQHLAKGYTGAEISEQLSVSEGTVKSQIHRGRKALKAAGIQPSL